MNFKINILTSRTYLFSQGRSFERNPFFFISNNDFKNDGPYNISESEINKMFKININQLFEKYNINSDELSLNKQEIDLITNIIEDKIINFQSVLNRTNKENWNNEIEKLNKLKLKINNYAI